MGNTLIKKVTPQQICPPQPRYSLMDPCDKSDISRANFRFLQRLTVTGYNQQQTVWLAENIRNSNQKFLVKQIDKLIMYDNNRILTALQQLQLWLEAYQENNIASLFLASLLFAFQDYQYMYMVYEHIEGFTLGSVLKHHVFSQEETKYVVGAVIQIVEFFHDKKCSLAELEPEHFFVEKETGRIKLLQIFNPMPIDSVYTYTVITNPSLYAAPQVLAKNKVLAESDYYTLGTMMYEMMTQKNPVLQELSHLQTIERHHIMAQQIELKKYNLPQGWDPQAADFLVKLLIKNPLYRLGRYGSFELRFHPWLQNYNWEILPTRAGISLTEPFFKKPQVRKFPNPTVTYPNQEAQRLLRSQLFLKFFQKYEFRRKIYPKQATNDFSPSQNKPPRPKKSQKYYDNSEDNEFSSDSDENQQEEEYCDDLEAESESMAKSYKEGQLMRGKQGKNNGRGLLNIVEKDG